MIATEVIKEALREYVGDGDGADEQVLADHDESVRRAVLREERGRGRWVVIVMWLAIIANGTFALLNMATLAVR